ncbi:unnamed protein product [Adineta steineri]|uniref:Uncharacterized protein n=1 Tax=Adineta steineri TaxID=433720 RepID=A0A816GBW3_9BILA|nr:unnamed protein product [Adineta steineri]CAF1672156.1 unnamed protein product [Adineta steineri]
MHLFPVTSNFANLASRLLCHIAGLGLETHIFAPEKLLLCVFRQVSSHTDIHSIFHLFGEPLFVLSHQLNN